MDRNWLGTSCENTLDLQIVPFPSIAIYIVTVHKYCLISSHAPPHHYFCSNHVTCFRMDTLDE